jgi:hypothetical protein
MSESLPGEVERFMAKSHEDPSKKNEQPGKWRPPGLHPRPECRYIVSDVISEFVMLFSLIRASAGCGSLCRAEGRSRHE